MLVCNFHFSIEFITREIDIYLLQLLQLSALSLSTVPAVRAIIWSFPLSRRWELRTSSSGSQTTGWWTRWDWGLAQPWEPQPPSRAGTWTTGAVSSASTCSLSTLTWRGSKRREIHRMEQQPCVQDIIVRDPWRQSPLIYFTPRHFDETLGRSEILQSILIHKISKHFHRETDVLCKSVPVAAWLPVCVSELSFKFTTLVTVQLQCICSSYLYIFKHKRWQCVV